MITGAAKAKVDAIWQKMWEGGITNPIEVISQLTYLMFMRSLDEREFEAESMEAVLVECLKSIFSLKLIGMRMVSKYLVVKCAGAGLKIRLLRKCIALLISSFSLSLKIWVVILLFLKRWKVQRSGFLQERPLCLKKRLMV